MKKTRRRYDRAFKISVVSDRRRQGIHPSFPSRCRDELSQIHPDIHPRLDPLESGIHDADEMKCGEGPPRQ